MPRINVKGDVLGYFQLLWCRQLLHANSEFESNIEIRRANAKQLVEDIFFSFFANDHEKSSE